MRSPLLPGLLVAALLAACGERPQDEARPPAAAVQAPAVAPPASATAAAAPREEMRPGFTPAEAARPRLHPGEPTSNDAFRRAFQERSAARASGGS